MENYRKTILDNAEKLRALYANIKLPYKTKPHREACEAFHSQYDALAFPDGWGNALEKLRNADVSIVEVSIQYLELTPRFHRSGYNEETILRHLKKATFTTKQITRLVHLILNSIKSGCGKKFDNYARLAGAMQDSRVLIGAQNLLNDSEPERQRRAQRILDIFKSRPPSLPSPA